MAKKFRCSTCGNIVEIDSTLEVITCPQCGKKYRNSYYDPYARMMGQAATIACPPNAQYVGGFGMPMYGAPYGNPYGAQPYMMPYGQAPVAGMGVAPVQQPVAAVAPETVEKAEAANANEAVDEDILDLDESDETEVVEDAADAEAEADEETEVEDEEINEEAFPAKRKQTLIRLNGKRCAYAFTLVFGLLLMVFVGLRIANVLQNDGYLDIYKSVNFAEYVQTAEFWNSIAYLPIVMAALAVVVLSAMHLSIANLRTQEVKNGKNLSKQIKSGKLAGYAFALIFSILALAYTGLVGVGGFALTCKDVFAGAEYETAELIDLIRLEINPYLVEIGLCFVSLVALTYFSFRISDTNKQYK